MRSHRERESQMFSAALPAVFVLRIGRSNSGLGNGKAALRLRVVGIALARRTEVLGLPRGARLAPLSTLANNIYMGMFGTLMGDAGPISEAAVRWRAVGVGMTATRDWNEGATDQAGLFFSSDMPEGKWELEICAKGYRPIRGVIVINQSLPIAGVSLRAERLNAKK